MFLKTVRLRMNIYNVNVEISKIFISQYVNRHLAKICKQVDIAHIWLLLIFKQNCFSNESPLCIFFKQQQKLFPLGGASHIAQTTPLFCHKSKFQKGHLDLSPFNGFTWSFSWSPSTYI